MLFLPSPFGRRWRAAPDEGTDLPLNGTLREAEPSPAPSGHPLPEGEGSKSAPCVGKQESSAQQPQQVLPVTRLGQRRGQFTHARRVDPAVLVCDFFGAAHF